MPRIFRFRTIRALLTRRRLQGARAVLYFVRRPTFFLVIVTLCAGSAALYVQQTFFSNIFFSQAESGVGEASGSSTFTPTFAANGAQVSRSSDTDREQLDPAIVSDGSTGAIIVYEDDNAEDGVYNIYAQHFGSTGTPFWVTGGVRLAASSSLQTDPVAVPDGSGGAVIFWNEGGGGTPDKIVGTRIDSSGAAVWGPTTFLYQSDVGGYCVTEVAEDGLGGAVIAAVKNASGTYTAEASAIGSDGVLDWTTTGQTISGSCLKTPIAVVPANNAVFVATQTSDWGWVQRLNLSDGAAQYSGDGVQVGVPAQSDYMLGIGSDGSTGFHVIVGGDRSDSCGFFCNNASSTLRAVRGDNSATSSVTLMSDELFESAFSTSFYDTGTPGQAVGDSAGNMYVAYQVVDSGSQGTILVQKVTSGGVNSWGSAITGGNGTMATAVAVDTDIDESGTPRIVLDGTGGVYVAWIQSHAFLGDADVYGQHLNSSGEVQWTSASQQLLDTGVAAGDGANVELFRASTTPWFTWDRSNDVFVQAGTEVAGSSGSSSNTNSTTESSASAYTVPVPPSARAPVALSPTSIRWYFTDNSSYESGFELSEEAPGMTPRVLMTTAPFYTTNRSYFDEIGLQVDTQYCNRVIRVFNDKGYSDPVTLVCGYTHANPPGNVRVQIISSTARRISWFANGNPAHTKYAIFERVRGFFIQPDGSFGSTPAWRTIDEWGAGGFVTNQLAAGAPYEFAVQAQNGEGASGELVSAGTDNPPPEFLLQQQITVRSGGVGSVVTSLNNGIAVRTGEIVTYQTFVKNESNRDAEGVVVTAAVPLGTAYMPGSVSYNDTVQTDILDADPTFVSENTVRVSPAVLPAGSMMTVSYAVAVTAKTGDISQSTCVGSAIGGNMCTVPTTNPVVGVAVIPVNTNTNTPPPANTNRPVNTNVNTPQPANTNTNTPPEPGEEQPPPSAEGVEGSVLIDNKPAGSEINDPSPEISGHAPPGSAVTVIVDGQVVGTTTADESGVYRLETGGSLADGEHTVMVRADGEDLTAALFIIDTIAPPAPVQLGLEVLRINILRRLRQGDTTIEVSGRTAPDTALVRLVIQSDPIVVSFPPPSEVWTRLVEARLDPGPHTVTAVAIDRAGNESEPVSRPFEIVIPEDEGILADIRSVLSSPIVQQTNAVAAPIVLGIAVMNMAAAAGTSTIFGFFGFLFTQPALLFARRRRGGYGVIYNTLSKLPVDLAIIRLREATSNRIIQTKVTDKVGRYMFAVPPGRYAVEVTKPGFTHPSTLMRGVREDVAYTDVLAEPTVSFAAASRMVHNIPLDPAVDTRTPAAIRAAASARVFQQLFAVSGPMLGLVSVAITPTPAVVGIAVFQFATYLLFRRLAYVTPPKSYGIVRDAKTRQPLAGVVVRIVETTYNKLLETQVTDARGRYAFLVGRNRFQVTAELSGYAPYRSNTIDLTVGEQTGLVAQDIVLSRGTGSPVQPPQSIRVVVPPQAKPVTPVIQPAPRPTPPPAPSAGPKGINPVP